MAIKKRALQILLLQRAWMILYDHDEDFICYALDVARDEYCCDLNDESYDRWSRKAIRETDRLKAWIHALLLKDYTLPNPEWEPCLHDWMKACHPQLCAAVSEEQLETKMRETRLDWIDWMVKEIFHGRGPK